jgi:hypothetical protein
MWFGPAVAVRHSPSPVATFLAFSTVTTLLASGTFDGSCATSGGA